MSRAVNARAGGAIPTASEKGPAVAAASVPRWSLAPAYREFLDAQLVTALAIPNGRAFAEFARRLQSIQAAVLRGELNPDEASIIMGGG